MDTIKSSNMTQDDVNDQHVPVDSPASPQHSKTFRCSVCCQVFLNRMIFKKHQRTHGGKMYTCSKCRKNFKSSSLTSHEKSYWLLKPYSCSLCRQDFTKLWDLKRHCQMHVSHEPYSCTRCGKAFSNFDLWRSHQVDEPCQKEVTAHRNPGDPCRAPVWQTDERQIIPSTYFKCCLCNHLHRHLCQHVLHLQTHTCGNLYSCEICRQRYDQTAELRNHCSVCCRNSGEEKMCTSSLTDIWKKPKSPENQVLQPDVDGQSVSPHEDHKALPQGETGKNVHAVTQTTVMSQGSLNVSLGCETKLEFDQVPQQPWRCHLQPVIPRYRRGKAIWWKRPRLPLHFQREITRRPFSCSRCHLEFHFLGSYVGHLQEHAAQTPHACLLCPDAFANIDDLNSHVSECHRRRDGVKCRVCRKVFSTRRNLKKHQLLHKGIRSHFCRTCDVSFSSNGALKTHLKTHMRCVSVPQPTESVEPSLVPNQGRKSTAELSNMDQLQGHQVCRFAAEPKPEDSLETVTSCIPSRNLEDQREAVPETPQLKCRLPVSDDKHLFRYPHPDHLYVVSSESPIPSATEEHRQGSHVQSRSVATSPRNAATFNSTHPGISDIPQVSLDMDEQQTGSSTNPGNDQSDSSSMVSESQQTTDDALDCDSHDVLRCLMCMEPFTDVSKLHEHYVNHARGV